MLFIILLPLQAQDVEKKETTPVNGFHYSGEVSLRGQYAADLEDQTWLGVRYIPRMNYGIELHKGGRFDFEASFKIAGEARYDDLDLTKSNGNIDFYRIWARYSYKQTEIKIGLQELKFGSSRLFRPLMWFDSDDPRDLQHLTRGVWGGVFRHNFTNSVNVWLWGLAGNTQLKGWESTKTAGSIQPEGGARIEYLFSFGHVGLMYNYRKVKANYTIDNTTQVTDKSPENRIGFDFRANTTAVNLWLDASLTNAKDLVYSTKNKALFTLGAEHTFDIGKGLNAVLEHTLYSLDEKAFGFENVYHATALSLSYPFFWESTISATGYYHWKGLKEYAFDEENSIVENTKRGFHSYLQWDKQFNALSLRFMGYWNPKDIYFPGFPLDARFIGKGAQIMLIWRH